MLAPHYLKQNDKILILSTARKVSREELHHAIELFKSWGLQVELGKSIGAAEHQFAGDDDLRKSDFQQGIDRPDIAAIFFARGGYGTVRILDGLNWSAFMKNPKWLCGYSDITVLHAYVNTYLGIQTLHCAMPFAFATNTSDTTESIRSVLFGKQVKYNFPAHALNKAGRVKARLVGGNLSVLYSLAGSSTQLQTDNCVLFLEDIDEYLYHIDRMMQNLKRSGKLKKIEGLVLGKFTDMKDNATPYGQSAYEIIHSYLAPDCIACFDFPSGHDNHNLSLIFGSTIELDVTANGCTLCFI